MRWAREGSSARVRFLTGAGGTGKTRLAAEVAQRLRKDGWEAGFVPLKGNPLQGLSKPGRLLIVDYPEDKRSRISELLRQLSMMEDSDVPVRILLLSRESFGRWQRELDASSVTPLCDAREIALSALTGSRGVELVRGLWKNLEALAMPGVQVPRLADDAIAAWVKKDERVHGCPLFLIAAGLHSALESGASFELSGADVVKALVRRERARLDRADPEGGKKHAIARLMAIAFFSGGLVPDTLRDLAEPGLELGLPAREAVLVFLKGTPWWRDGGFARPSPDIVAAVLAYQVFAEAEDDALVSEWLWPALRDAVQSEPAEQVLGRIDRADRQGCRQRDQHRQGR